MAAMLGWLQLAPAFGFPVTAPAGMLDRLFGASRESGPTGWALLLVGLATLAVFYVLIVERRAHRLLWSVAFIGAAWLISGAVVMPLVGLLQGAPAPGALPSDPMRANFFMLNLGPGAAVESLLGWAIFGAVLAAGTTLSVDVRALSLAFGAAVLGGLVAFVVPSLTAPAPSGRVVDGSVAALPPGPVFISVLELPQPPGAVLGPHTHVAGFVLSTSGVATVVIGGDAVDVGPGASLFTPDQASHDHENRAAVPLAIALAAVIVGLTAAALLWPRRDLAVVPIAALLVAGTVAAINPLMNHWYFISVRPAAQRGAAMPVPAGHRTYESDALTGLPSGRVVERLTDRRLGTGDSVEFLGQAAVIVLDGEASVVAEGRTVGLSARSGTTITGATTAAVRATSGAARVLILQVLPAN